MPISQTLERGTARAEVVKILSRTIATGEIATGEFLPAERELASRLGVSRVIVREASKALEEQGLVRIRHGIGVEVVNNSALPVEKTIERLVHEGKERLRQCAEARLLIEPELAALAAMQAGSRAVKHIQASIDAMEHASDLAALVESDVEFHERVAEATGNQVLSLMLRSTVSIGRQNRAVTLEKEGVSKAVRQHQIILRAIASHQPNAARNEMRKHLRSALSDLDSSISQ